MCHVKVSVKISVMGSATSPTHAASRLTNLNKPKPMRALIADDERLLREQLQARLAESWPDLQICGIARDGLEAVRLADTLRPNVVFLDIRMPGLTGLEAAREIAGLEGWRGEMAFVNAYDEYAVTAFWQGVVDDLLKPVETARHEKTVARLRARLLQAAQPDRPLDVLGAQGALLATLARWQQSLNPDKALPTLRWRNAAWVPPPG